MDEAREECLVLLSGGQDSTTCLYWAKREFEFVHTLTINYGQRHNIELSAALKIAKLALIESYEVLDILNVLQGTSPLINRDNQVGQYNSVEDLPAGVEPTFVPGRNIFFLTIIANRAYCKGIRDIVIGVSQVDYGGYVDCRKDFIVSMQQALSQGLYGTNDSINIHTPLLNLSKRETVELAQEVGAMEALKYSVTCYRGKKPPCGKCHSCLLRERGFKEAGVRDPLLDL